MTGELIRGLEVEHKGAVRLAACLEGRVVVRARGAEPA